MNAMQVGLLCNLKKNCMIAGMADCFALSQAQIFQQFHWRWFYNFIHIFSMAQMFLMEKTQDVNIQALLCVLSVQGFF